MGLNTKEIKKILKDKKVVNFGRVLNWRGFVSLVTILVMLGLIGAEVFPLWQKSDTTAQAQGQEPPEIVEFRGENSKTYDLGKTPDGRQKYALDIGIGAIHYKDNYADANEQWKDIDLTWEGNRITKAPYILEKDGKKITVTDKKTGEVSTIELLNSKPAGLKTEIVPENTRVSFRHILPTDKVPFEAKFQVTGNIPMRNRAFDDEGELELETTIKDGILTEKLSQVKDKETRQVRPAKGNIRIDPTLSLQVGASADDAYVSVVNTSTPPHTWTALQRLNVVVLVGESGTARYGIGVRFLNITLVSTDTIDVAYLTMNPSGTYSGVVVRSNIYGEDADDAATYSTVANYNGRAKTAAVVADNLGTWTLDVPVNSPSIVAPVTTIKNRAGWASGNAMAFMWEDNGSDDQASRRADSWDADTTLAPKLHIEYTAGAAEVTAPARGADHTPPARYSDQPTGTLAEGTTQTTISLTTNEPTTCKYSTERWIPYYLMTNTFSAGEGINNLFPHSSLITGLRGGNTYNYYFKCLDNKGNVNFDDFLISFSVAADVTPPVLSNGQPTGTLDAGTTQTDISLTTNEPATCQYSITAGTNYGSMPNTFSATGGISHSTSLTGLGSGETYTYYVRCSDNRDNTNTDDFTISFSIIPFVTLTTDPSSGQAPLYGVDLTTTVSGTETGTIHYIFYCNRSDAGTNITPDYSVRYNSVAFVSQEADDVCNYLSPGTYYPKVIVERGLSIAEARAEITVTEKSPKTEVVPEKPVAEMTIEEIRAKIIELQQKLIELIKQLIQLIQKQMTQL